MFRIIGFIEGFIRQFTDEPLTCVGGSCGDGPGVYEGVTPGDLGKILTALLTFPIDLLIGDSNVACSEICPTGIDNFTGDDRCSCWDLSPNFPGSLQDRVYVLETGGACAAAPSDPCCRLTVIEAGHVEFQQTCQSPNGPEGDNASCITNVACRPDSLPSCVSHPDTPVFLAAFFPGSIDGILIGLMRYMQCVLGPVGIIFRPLIILFSILWQIFGGEKRREEKREKCLL